MELFEDSYLRIDHIADKIVNFSVNIIELTKNGKLIFEEYEFKTNANILLGTNIIKLPHEKLVALSIQTNDFVLRGQFYVSAKIQKGYGPGAKELITLLSGYVTKTKPLAYPPINLESATTGNGAIKKHYISYADPQISFGLIENKLIKIIQVYGAVTTNANDPANKVIIAIDWGEYLLPKYATKQSFTTPGGISFFFSNFGEIPDFLNHGFEEVYPNVYGIIPEEYLTPTDQIHFILKTSHPNTSWDLIIFTEEWFYL